MSVKEMAKDIKECIEEKEIEDFYIFGHSLGGKIGMSLVSEYEYLHKRVKGLVVGDMGCFDYWCEDDHRVQMPFIKEQEIMNYRLMKIDTLSQPKHKIHEQVLEACSGNPKVADSIM